MTTSNAVPTDPYKLVYIIFYGLGIATLLPWNFFLSVNGYWMYKFREVANSTGEDGLLNAPVPASNITKLSDLQLAWAPYLSMCAMIPNVTVLLLNALFGHKIKTTPRLIVSLVSIIVIFIFTDVMTKENTDTWQDTFMGVTLLSVVVFNIMVAVLQGGLMGVAGRFPPAYMGALVQGQALGGIIAVCTNISMLAVGLDDTNAAFWDFLIATIYLATSLVAFLVVTKTDFYKFYAGETPTDTPSNESDEKSPEMDQLLEEGTGSDKQTEATIQVPIGSNSTSLQIVARIWVWILSVFICFFTTLAVFPAITVLAYSTQYDQNTAWSRIYFIPVACFLVFNLGDYFGRLLASWLQWPGASNRGGLITLAISTIRLAFIPLFIFCNISPNNRNLTQVYFESDTAYIILMALFSLSSGYLGNICMTFGPKMMTNPRDQGQAASLLVFFLVFGLAIGSGVSPLSVKLL